MSFPTAVNSQITNSGVLANATLIQALAHSLSNAAHNAVTAQQQTDVTAQAATTMMVATLLSDETAVQKKGR